MAICVLFTPAANTLVSLHICAGVINIKISCAGSKGSWEYARLHRLAWAFYTVSKYHLLVEMAIFAMFMWTANDVVSLHQQPQEFCATISALYQCVKKCSQCVVIKILNKTFASLPRKKKQSSNRFFGYCFMGIWQQLCLDMQISLNLGSYTRKSTCHGKTPELCWIFHSNQELNHQLLGNAINCNLADGLCAWCHHK